MYDRLVAFTGQTNTTLLAQHDKYLHFSEAIECNEPIAVVSHKVGVCRVHKDGKSCRTVFIRDSFDGTNSIVKCKNIVP